MRTGREFEPAGAGASNSGWGGRIRAARERAGLTQAQLAQRLGVSRGAPSLWEIDHAKPDADRLVDIARELGVSVDYIVGLEAIGTAERRGASTAMPTVPLLAPSEIGQWAAGKYEPNGGERVQTQAVYAYGKAVAMRVANNAMAPAFPPDSIVIVSREHAVVGGCPVVVDMGRGAPMLRYLIDEGVEPMLSPENPQFPVVPLGRGRIVGRVVEVVIRRSLL
ncbi:MAG: helix-turn-helix domain-containing protein [Alphaproteobacteria bacterium]|nr:helix-turn-helix domain-containing protein [Alphaproteobacteria bacterium]